MFALLAVDGMLVLAFHVIFAEIYAISLITKCLTHLGLVCDIHQPELRGDTTVESKAFQFSSGEAGEKYSKTPQRKNLVFEE